MPFKATVNLLSFRWGHILRLFKAYSTSGILKESETPVPRRLDQKNLLSYSKEKSMEKFSIPFNDNTNYWELERKQIIIHDYILR